MYLYLVQHGEAKSKEEDPARPLSEKGARDVRKVASFVSQAGITVDAIHQSGKQRAADTAGIFAELLTPGEGVVESAGLAPMDEPGIWAERLKGEHRNLMLVGHLPHMGRLASLLLAGQSEGGLVEFRMGGVLCLRGEEGRWSVQWMVVPDLLK